MKVAVVGLGAAGLRATMLLEAAGHNPLLYEARPRLGGRLRTYREPGLAFDTGGEWFDADHHRCLSLLSELGIESDPAVSWPGRVVFQGNECWDDTLWTDALEDDLRVEAAARELCRELDTIPWRNTSHRDLDRKTLADFLRENTHSERGYWWTMANLRSDEGEDPERISLLGWLCGFMHYLDRESTAMSAFRVPGGMGRLVDGMASRLESKVHTDAVLERVCRGTDSVTLQFENFEVDVDHAILTLPPPCLERIVFDPPLSCDKRCAIEACRMSRVVKLVWEFDRPWWREGGWSGRLLCDRPLQQVWDGTRDDRPVLTAYVCGDDAEHWIKHSNPVQGGLEELIRLAPEARNTFVQGWFFDWVNDPFSHGAFSHLPQHYVLDYMPHIREPEGRVHFAGEHTAFWTGFIEGSLESAERVVQEVLDGHVS